MQVILLQDVEKLGNQHDVVVVRNGYGRNYLIPQGKALVANSSNLKMAEERKKQEERREEKLLSQLQQVIDSLKDSVVRIGAKVGTSGKIFGSVTTSQIADAIKKQKSVNIDKKKISIVDEEVKNVGTYTARIDLHKDVKVDIQFEVVGE